MWNESKLQWYWPLNCVFLEIKYISFLATCGFIQLPRTKSKMIVEILGNIKSMKNELKHQSEWKVFHSIWTFIYPRILLLYVWFSFLFCKWIEMQSFGSDENKKLLKLVLNACFPAYSLPSILSISFIQDSGTQQCIELHKKNKTFDSIRHKH